MYKTPKYTTAAIQTGLKIKLGESFMKAGDLVAWLQKPMNTPLRIGIVLSYCSFKKTCHVRFSNCSYRIKERYLVVISEIR